MQATETTINSNGITCHTSKWGHHPCDYETYLKLKKINKHWQRAIHIAAAWERWNRKAKWNRVIRHRIRNNKGQVIGYEEAQPLAEPQLVPPFHEIGCKNTWSQTVLLCKTVDILAEYRNARYPKQNPEDVKAMKISTEKINSLLSELE